MRRRARPLLPSPLSSPLACQPEVSTFQTTVNIVQTSDNQLSQFDRRPRGMTNPATWPSSSDKFMNTWAKGAGVPEPSAAGSSRRLARVSITTRARKPYRKSQVSRNVFGCTAASLLAPCGRHGHRSPCRDRKRASMPSQILTVWRRATPRRISPHDDATDHGSKQPATEGRHAAGHDPRHAAHGIGRQHQPREE